MLADRKVGLHAIELMTDLGVLDNYVAQICQPIRVKNEEEKIPEVCFIKDTQD